MEWTRRQFLGSSTLAGAGWVLASNSAAQGAEEQRLPAILGGPRTFPAPQPSWPVWSEADEAAVTDVVRSGKWFRGNGKSVVRFEDSFAELMGARHCLATASGTAAITAALGALDVGPGDEVLIPPYTFVATYNAVVIHHALPVFVDTDPESFQIDATKLEAAITPQTRALLPVHLAGSPADIDRIQEVARKLSVPVVEDACQAHLAEWRGRKVGTWGQAGCFSFQASKNLTSGEGGAILTSDDAFAEACYRFHYHGRGRRFTKAGPELSGTRGSNLRLSEFQAALLLAQMTRLEEQAKRRHGNATLLSSLLREIPGIRPAKLHEGTTRGAWHLYMFAYDKAQFAELDRSRFLEALSREGIPGSSGYTALPRDTYISALATNRHYLRIYGEARMKQWLEQNLACPANDRVCATAVWFSQNVLLGTTEDMERIADAIRRIQRHAGAIAKA